MIHHPHMLTLVAAEQIADWHRLATGHNAITRTRRNPARRRPARRILT
jgi:hypothetical protein